MNKNSLVLLVALVCYPILIFFCLKFYKEEYTENMCYFARPCVRFCCKIEEECTNSYIKENFNSSEVVQYEFISFDDSYEDNNDTEKFQIYIGKPKCFLSKSIETKDWKFSSVSLYRL